MREKRPLVWPEYRSVSSPLFLPLTLLPALSRYHSFLHQSYCFTCTLINFPRISMVCLHIIHLSTCLGLHLSCLSMIWFHLQPELRECMHTCAQDVDGSPTLAWCERRQTETGDAYSKRADGSGPKEASVSSACARRTLNDEPTRQHQR